MTDTFEVHRMVSRSRPIILFHRIRFTGKGLMRGEFLGKTVVLTIQPADIRTLKARLPSGKNLGTLEMVGRKFEHPMPLDEWQQKLRKHK